MDRDFLSDFLTTKSFFISRAMLADITLELEKFYLFKTAFAITKAENSQLTEAEALEIYDKRYREYNNDYFNEIKPHCEELLEEVRKNRYNKKAKNQLIKYHDKLEFYNILKVIEFIKYHNKEELYKNVYENGVTIELIQNLHFILTDGLDELFLNANIPDYSPYFPWEIRRTDNIRVWRSNVLPADSIEGSLEEINYLSRSIGNVFDIYEIHGKMYHTHIFHNGNKRVSRIIEELLLSIYWYTNGLPTTYGYYLLERYYINVLVRDTLEKKNFSEWANFAYSSSLLIVLDTMCNLIKKLIEDNISLRWMYDYMDSLPLKYNFRRKDMVALYDKKFRWSQEVEDAIDNALKYGIKYSLLEAKLENDGEYLYQYLFENDFSREVYEQYIEVFDMIKKTGLTYIAQFPKYIIWEELKYL